jgi:hypothetical protein
MNSNQSSIPKGHENLFEDPGRAMNSNQSSIPKGHENLFEDPGGAISEIF